MHSICILQILPAKKKIMAVRVKGLFFLFSSSNAGETRIYPERKKTADLKKTRLTSSSRMLNTCVL